MLLSVFPGLTEERDEEDLRNFLRNKTAPKWTHDNFLIKLI